jgi:hypothetical protein
MSEVKLSEADYEELCEHCASKEDTPDNPKEWCNDGLVSECGLLKCHKREIKSARLQTLEDVEKALPCEGNKRDENKMDNYTQGWNVLFGFVH